VFDRLRPALLDLHFTCQLQLLFIFQILGFQRTYFPCQLANEVVKFSLIPLRLLETTYSLLLILYFLFLALGKLFAIIFAYLNLPCPL
jgi:hypothetical protein